MRTACAEPLGAAGAVVLGARLVAAAEASGVLPEPQADTASNPDRQSARTAPERIIAFLLFPPRYLIVNDGATGRILPAAVRAIPRSAPSRCVPCLAQARLLHLETPVGPRVIQRSSANGLAERAIA